jgi:hypothetical protein
MTAQLFSVQAAQLLVHAVLAAKRLSLSVRILKIVIATKVWVDELAAAVQSPACSIVAQTLHIGSSSSSSSHLR